MSNEIANTILKQLGFWVRGCLDMKGQYCRAKEDGVTILGCLISTGPNRRGSIEITLNGKDLYDIKITNAKGEQTEEFEDMYADQMVEMMQKRAGLK